MMMKLMNKRIFGILRSESCAGKPEDNSSMTKLLCTRCQFDQQSIHSIGNPELATQTAIIFYEKSLIQHVFFCLLEPGKIMIAEHIDVAGRTKSHAAASTQYGQITGLAYFH